MKADILANLQLYHNFCCIIKIKIHNYLYLCTSAVDIEIITSPHFSLHSPAVLPFDIKFHTRSPPGQQVTANRVDSCGTGPESK